MTLFASHSSTFNSFSSFAKTGASRAEAEAEAVCPKAIKSRKELNEEK